MTAALALARRGLGRVSPNPAVGCVVVAAGRAIGRGWTQPGGRPHAETEALCRAGPAARGATAYISLEPCSHHGKTPPCTDALIGSGIKRCVISCEDPDPRVSGRGIAALQQAGIDVEVGLCADTARELNRGFFLNKLTGRPLVSLKLATSLDGRIALASGESKWITGEAARARAHLLRASHDAILVGGGTALADNPRLDVRLPGLDVRSPVRVVMDRRLRLPVEHDLVAQARVRPTLLFTATQHDEAALAGYRESGVEVVACEGADDDSRFPEVVLKALAERGLTRIFLEGGAGTATSFLRAGLVDRLEWFRAPVLIGADGLPGTGRLELESLVQAPVFRREALESLGEDLLERYRREAA
ncbi:MAG: bifunctional diaminohydroxyphosphoribosylaminopyrimidine deaminase/5-amino-6-(5-phosphoribosylamino)uracil reductase RibD [Pseudomonadota bacterium]